MNASKISNATAHGLVAASLLYALVSLSINGGAQALLPASRITLVLMVLAFIFSAIATGLHVGCIRKVLPGSLQNRVNLDSLARCIGNMLAVSLFGIFLYCSLFMIGPFAPKGMPFTVFALIFACAAIPLVWLPMVFPRGKRWPTLAGVAPLCLMSMIATLALLYWTKEIWLAFMVYAILALGIVVVRMRGALGVIPGKEK